VRHLGLEDTVADNLIDWCMEHSPELAGIMIEAEKESSPAKFTPTQDPHLRDQLSLDQIEYGWLSSFKRTSLKGELAKAGATLPLLHRMSGDAKEFLKYGLFARRKRNERLFVMCMAGLLRSEFLCKFFSGNLALTVKNSESLRNFRLIAGIDADANPNEFFDIAEKRITPEALINFKHFMQSIDEQRWPSGYNADDILECVLGGGLKGSWLTRMTCQID
jgi:hypothetical protein